MAKNRTLNELEKQELKNAYETTALAALGKQFNIPVTQVKEVLSDMGVALRGRGRIKRKGTNQMNEIHLVEEETPEELVEPMFDEDDEGFVSTNYFGD